MSYETNKILKYYFGGYDKLYKTVVRTLRKYEEKGLKKEIGSDKFKKYILEQFSNPKLSPNDYGVFAGCVESICQKEARREQKRNKEIYEEAKLSLTVKDLEKRQEEEEERTGIHPEEFNLR